MNLAEELTTVTRSIERLKRRYARRRADMAQLHNKGARQELSTPSFPEPDGREPPPTKAPSDPNMTIKRLLACCLLAPSTSIPVDTLGLHSKVSIDFLSRFPPVALPMARSVDLSRAFRRRI